MLSNTTITRKHERSVLPIDIPPVPCQACKWQIWTAHQSNENFICDDYTIEFMNECIFEFATEVNEETANENDDVPEENYMTIFVKMINGMTISIKCEGKQTVAFISDEVERRSLIPRDMTYLVHKGKVMSEKKTIETQEEREKKRKLEEGKEGQMTKPNECT